jgi:hypothetical protein
MRTRQVYTFPSACIIERPSLTYQHGEATVAEFNILQGKNSKYKVRRRRSIVHARGVVRDRPTCESSAHTTYQQSDLLGRLVVQGDTKVSGTEVTRALSGAFSDKELVRTKDHGDLAPSVQGDDIQGGQAVGDIGKLEVERGGEETLKAGRLLHQHTQGGSHGDTTVLDFDLTIPTKVVLRASIWSILDESKRAAITSKKGKGTKLAEGPKDIAAKQPVPSLSHLPSL